MSSVPKSKALEPELGRPDDPEEAISNLEQTDPKEIGF